MAEHDVEAVWQKFWLPILKARDLPATDRFARVADRDFDGVSLDQIKRELYDFRTMMEGIPGLYDEITGGQITKPNTEMRHVLNAYAEHVERLVEEAVQEQREIQQEDANDSAWQRGYDTGYEEGRDLGRDEGNSLAKSDLRDYLDGF